MGNRLKGAVVDTESRTGGNGSKQLREDGAWVKAFKVEVIRRGWMGDESRRKRQQNLLLDLR